MSSYHRPRESLAVFDPLAKGLVPNDQLSFLPPLPETPRHATASTSGPITSYFNRQQQPSYTMQVVNFGEDLVETNEEPAVKRLESTRSLVDDYPVLSTRQGGMNTPRRRSPIKRAHHASDSHPDIPTVLDVFSPSLNPAGIPLPETPAASTHLLSPDKSRLASTSFNMLAVTGDTSLIGDCRPPSSMGQFEDSFDFQIEAIRPLTGRRARISMAPSRDGGSIELPVESLDPGAELLRSPTRVGRNVLAESTLLPTSPRQLDLLASTNALTRVQPPWNAEKSSVKSAPRSVSKSKRTFPASASGQSLASVGEEKEAPFVGDASTLLPTSPDKMRHLLHPQYMLQNEDFSLLAADGQSIFHPRSISTVLEHNQPSAQKPRRHVRSPVKAADVTIDLKDIMARMSKPKRASGGELSFMDLLHGSHDLDEPEGLDGDETFIPANLRPARHLIGQTRTARRRSKSLSEVVQAQVPLTMRQIPAKRLDTIATPKPRKSMGVPARSSIPSKTHTSKRISLSAGALPMPTSASHRTMLLPKTREEPRGAPLAQPHATATANASPAKPRVGSVPSITSAVPRSHSSRTLGLTTATSSALPTRPTALSSRPAGSIPARTSFKPTTAPAPTTASSRLARPSTRPTGLPLPGNDGTARSAPSPVQSSREFGREATTALNRPSRSMAPPRSTLSSKLSSTTVAPSRMTAPTTATLKSRAMSTPATAQQTAPRVIRPTVSRPPTERSAGIPRPTTRVPVSSSTTTEAKSGKATMEDIRARLSRLQGRQTVKR